MTPKKWLIVCTDAHWLGEVRVVSKLFDTLKEARVFYDKCHSQHDLEYFIMETIYG